MINKIKIKGLRGFGVEKKICLSKADNVNIGSGLNVFVGPNNSGKTTIIEALKYFNASSENGISFSEGKRNRKTLEKVEISYYYDSLNQKGEKCENISTLKTIEQGGSEVEILYPATNSKIPFVLNSRRYANYEMHNNRSFSDRYNYSLNNLSNYKNRGVTLDNFDQRVFSWNKNKEKFDKILNRIIKNAFDWVIEQNEQGQYYIKICYGNGIHHNREGIGDGMWSIFTIVDALYDSQVDDVIIIDEPELSLHPSYQKELLYLLEEYSRDRQIIISTHSPYFVSWSSILNGGNLIRTYKNPDEDIEIGYLDKNDKTFIKQLLADLNNPHTLGLEAKEVFFLPDNILIVEGQEDKVILQKIAASLNCEIIPEIFGWGAGGADKIIGLVRVLKHLGYQKVSILYDGDKELDYNNCLKEFPEYNVEKLFANDIRDKKAINKPKKLGISSTKGIVKSQFKMKTINLIERINKYHEIV